MSIDVKFNSSTYATDTGIDGVVVVECQKELKAKGVFVELKVEERGARDLRGKELGSTSISIGGPKKPKGTKHSGSQRELFSVSFNVIPPNANFPSAGDNCVSIPPGVHSFPFVLRLPETCPSSVNLRWGYGVEYKFRAYVQRPWAFDIKFSDRLNVHAHVPRNIFEQCNQPKEICETKVPNAVMRKIFKAGEGVTLKARLPKLIFYSGETVPIELFLTNPSNRKINSIDARLECTVMSNAFHDKKQGVYTLGSASVPGDQVREGAATVLQYHIEDPRFFSTFTTELIQISYCLNIIVRIKGVATNLRLPIDVVVASGCCDKGSNSTVNRSLPAPLIYDEPKEGVPEEVDGQEVDAPAPRVMTQQDRHALKKCRTDKALLASNVNTQTYDYPAAQWEVPPVKC